MKKVLLTFIITISIGIMSCERAIENDSSQPKPSFLSGEWIIKAYLDDNPITDSFDLVAYDDPSSKTDSITLKDMTKQFWNFQVKVKTNDENETFNTEQSTCEVSDLGIGIKVLNGKIINSDSIYLEIQFEDDEIPYGTTYHLKGHRVNLN